MKVLIPQLMSGFVCLDKKNNTPGKIGVAKI